MKTLIVAVLITAAAVALALATTSKDGEAAKTLTAIDAVPTKEQIDKAFQKDNKPPLPTLVAIAKDADPDPDVISIRLRAIHALAKYCTSAPCTSSDTAHQAVADVITDTKDATTGHEVLILRAAIETIGSMRVSSDVATLVPLLEKPNRDIRAATARALRDLCNPQAIPHLRTRYAAETTDQVKLAISEALRILGQCAASP